MTNTYITKTSNYTLDPNDEPILGIEVPEGFIKDLDLHVNEVLKWVIDPDKKTAMITKENIIINQ